MKHGKLITWFSAALAGIAAAVACYADMTAEAAWEQFTEGDYVCLRNTETDEIMVNRYTGSAVDVTVPSSISGKPVTRIDGGCFSASSLRSVVIPTSVTFIQSGSFTNCRALTSVTILGAAELEVRAFAGCSALERVQLSDSSRTVTRSCHEAFRDCPSLYSVNGVQALLHATDSNGIQYPVINPAITTAIRNHFSRSVNVGFVNDYCTELCNYIVKTETSYDPDGPDYQPNDWMNDALKARQLHDWLIRHCEYEDQLNGESIYDNENHVASSVFLSYALNVRGEGIGETVCDGFAKAYTMLLAAAGIESHYIGHSSHVWNLVKIGGKYYHVDVTNDNSYNRPNWTQYGTAYIYFLKKSLYGNAQQTLLNDHPLLMVYQNDITYEIDHCPENYPDYNGDGILEYDLDLDGNAFQGSDWEAYNGVYNGLMQFSFGFCGWETINNRMPEVLYYLHQHHESYWTYVNNSAPKNVTTAYGQTARFEVNLFGDGLTYQWIYFDTAANEWRNLTVPTAQDAVLEIPAVGTTNGMQFSCAVRNKNDIVIYCCPVTLTVI